MAKKTFYKRPVKNAKLKEIQEQFENYKERNNVKVSEILKLRETNERLRKALEFYANQKNWKRHNTLEPYSLDGGYEAPTWEPSEIEFDEGKKARQALGGETNE